MGAILGIELNDAGIRAHLRGEPIAVDSGRSSSPAYARLLPNGVDVGVSAESTARVHPLDTITDAWDRLGTEPAFSRRPDGPNRAEVACAQLKQVARETGAGDEDTVISVPASYDSRQLGMIVRMAQEIGLRLRALVARPITIDDPGEGGTGREDSADAATVLVDLSMRRCTLSVVHREDRVTISAERSVPAAGLDVFRRRWLDAIGSEFLRTTRFDPLQDHATEQLLFDRLPAIINELAENKSLTLRLATGNGDVSAMISADSLARASQSTTLTVCAAARELVSAGPVGAVLLAHTAAQVPGLVEAVRRQVDAPIRVLGEDAAVAGLARLWPGAFDAPGPEGVAYHASRPARSSGPAEGG